MFACLYRVIRCLCCHPCGGEEAVRSPAPVVFSSHEDVDSIPWDNVRHKFDVVKHLSRSNSTVSDLVAPVIPPDMAQAHNNFILTWIKRYNQDRPPLSPVSDGDLNTAV